MTHALAGLPSSHNSIVAVVEDGGSYFNNALSDNSELAVSTAPVPQL